MFPDKKPGSGSWILALLFAIALLLAVNLVATLLPKINSHSYTVAGKDGKDAVVDYSKIDAIVQTRVNTAINALPLPAPGPAGPSGSQGPIGPQGLQGEKGDKGDSPICRQIEVQQNPISELAEYRFVGDDIWLPTPKDGRLPNACEQSDGSDSGAL